MNLIRQKEPSDCGIAAIAMFTKLSYDEVRSCAINTSYFKKKHGTYSCSGILRKLGFEQENYSGDNSYITKSGKFKSIPHIHHYISGSALRQLLWGRRCLISVESLNNENGLHLIYYDGENILDPQNGRKGKKYFDYKDWNKINPKEIYIWKENYEK